ncbi:MAG: hypothetical protein WC942_07335 [Clostridia bacterium]|jgi:hypothetical protein
MLTTENLVTKELVLLEKDVVKAPKTFGYKRNMLTRKNIIMNDKEREMWVMNDEGLYSMWKRSKLSKRNFIKTNRVFIDKVINNVSSGVRQAHYLVYG